MCDSIHMHDGKEIECINEDNVCLCNETQESILAYIGSRIPELLLNQSVVIHKSAFGWVVEIRERTGANADDPFKK